MAEQTPNGASATRAAPEVVAPTNRINVALPFSHLQVEETSADLKELAGIVTELAALVEAGAPGTKVSQLHKRARALAARLG